MLEIVQVCAKDDYMLTVHLSNGCALVIDFKQKLQTMRFSLLSNEEYFKSASAHGVCVRWNGRLEISLSELFQIVQKDPSAPLPSSGQ